MKKQSHYVVEERQIDVKEMFFHTLSCWRFILLVAFIAAALVGVMKYKSDVSAREAEIQAQIDAANAPEVTIETVQSQMLKKEAQTVWNAVQSAQLLAQKREYIDSSIYLNLNAFEENVTYLTFEITSGAAERAVSEIETYLSGVSMGNALAEDMGLDTDAIYLAELVRMEESDYVTYFKLRVCANSSEECANLADSVEKQMNAYINTLKSQEKFADLSITCTERKQDIICDEELLAKQDEYINGFYEAIKEQKKYESEFNDAQKELFKMLQKEKVVVENSIYPMEEAAEEEKEAAEIDTTVNVKPSIAAIIAGFLAGAIAAFAIRAFLYTISKNIHGEDEVKYLFGTNVFGVVDASSHGKKRLAAPVDRLFKRFKAGSKKSLTYEEQLQLVCTNILIQCKNNGVDKVHLSGSEMKKIPAVLINTLRETLEKAGIEVSNGKGVAYDAESLMSLAEKKNGILVEVSEKTSCAEIAKELNLCRQNEINVLGVVLVEIA